MVGRACFVALGRRTAALGPRLRGGDVSTSEQGGDFGYEALRGGDVSTSEQGGDFGSKPCAGVT